jgi:hypothetical protein
MARPALRRVVGRTESTYSVMYDRGLFLNFVYVVRGNYWGFYYLIMLLEITYRTYDKFLARKDVY